MIRMPDYPSGSGPHDRIVTPDTDPDRWTAEEADLFRRGLCSDVVEYGNGRGVIHCGEPSKPGASFGHCDEHDAEMLVDHYPDGTNRPVYGERERALYDPGYMDRVNAMAEAAERAEAKRAASS